MSVQDIIGLLQSMADLWYKGSQSYDIGLKGHWGGQVSTSATQTYEECCIAKSISGSATDTYSFKSQLEGREGGKRKRIAGVQDFFTFEGVTVVGNVGKSQSFEVM